MHASLPVPEAGLGQDFKSSRFNQNERNQMRWGNQPVVVIDGLVCASSRIDS
jgi:hypothetical protein